MFCENCGAQLPDKVKFCENCGAAVENSENKLATYLSKFNLKKILLIGMGTVIVVVAIVLIASLAGGSSDADSPLIYYTGEGVYTRYDNEDHSTRISEAYTNDYYLSDNGKLFLYMNDCDIYYTNPTKEAKSVDTQSKKLASNVTYSDYEYGYFDVYNDGEGVVYLKNKKLNGGKLYYNNFKEEILLEKNVEAFTIVSGDTVAYKKDGSLYEKKIKGKSEAEKMIGLNDVYDFNILDNGDVIFYVESDNDEYIYNMYIKESGKKKELIASDLVNYAQDNNATYYTISSEESNDLTLYDFVNDPYVGLDTELAAPDSDDYQKCNSTFGFTYYCTDYDAYSDAYDKYMEKEGRDDIRKALKESAAGANLSNLYVYEDGKSTLLSENVYHFSLMSGVEGVSYLKCNKLEAQKVIDIDDIDYLYNVTDVIGAKIKYDLYGCIDGEQGSLLMSDTKGEDGCSIMGVNDTWAVYTCFDDNNKEILYAGKVSSNNIESLKKVESNIFGVCYSSPEDTLYYYSDYDSWEYDLNSYDGSKKKKVLEGISVDSLKFMSKNQFIYMKDFSDTSEEGSLYVNKGGKEEKLTEEVYDAFIHNGKIYFCTNYSDSGSYDIYKYSKKDKKERIAEDVVELLSW